ncbi:MAG TPA: hypothetical protein VIT93_00910 [Dehalococcoidia bacterium]
MADEKQPKQKPAKTPEIPAWKRKEAMRDQKRAGRGNERARPIRQPQKH